MSDIYLLFLMGFFGGLHCIGMCGPIVLAYSVNLSTHTKQTSSLKSLSTLLNHIAYNLGRTVTYTFFGALAGFLGSMAFYFKENRGYIMIFFGSLIILFSLILIGFLRHLEKYFVTSHFFGTVLKKRMGGLLTSGKSMHRFYFGLINGMFPCGLSYGAIIKSLSAGSAFTGGLGMLLFGLGTAPALIITGYFSGFLGGFFRKYGDKIAGLFLLYMGVKMLYKGIMMM